MFSNFLSSVLSFVFHLHIVTHMSVVVLFFSQVIYAYLFCSLSIGVCPQK